MQFTFIFPAYCPAGYVKGPRKCFKAFTKAKTWDDAQAFCKKSEGGRLAEPRDFDDQYSISR